jgi:hypothetical protein
MPSLGNQDKGSTNHGNTSYIRLATGWAFWQQHNDNPNDDFVGGAGENSADLVNGHPRISLGYTTGGIGVEFSSDENNIEADQVLTPVLTSIQNMTLRITLPLMEWKKDNMLLALPGAELRQDAQGGTYVALTGNVSSKTGTLYIHPTDRADDDFSGDHFYTNVSPIPNTSFTMDGRAAQVLSLELNASPGNYPYAERNGDTAYFDHIPFNQVIQPTTLTITEGAGTTAVTSVDIPVGGRAVLKANVLPDDATYKKVTWRAVEDATDDPLVDSTEVSVSEDGEVFVDPSASSTYEADIIATIAGTTITQTVHVAPH